MTVDRSLSQRGLEIVCNKSSEAEQRPLIHCRFRPIHQDHCAGIVSDPEHQIYWVSLECRYFLTFPLVLAISSSNQISMQTIRILSCQTVSGVLAQV